MTVWIGDGLTFEDVDAVATGSAEIRIRPEVKTAMEPARRVVEEAVSSGNTVYGVTTGFGGLANVHIAGADAIRLQHDIVRSHATAVGDHLPREIVRAMMLLRARTFAFGISGVRFELVEGFVRFLQEQIHPCVPAQGSLGASGDLALLAHLALPLIGEGWVEHEGNVLPAAEVLRSKGIEPLTLSYKEGLSLVNGTEAMLALGISNLLGAERLARAADIAGAMTVEACLGTDQAFMADIVSLRKHPGALAVADNLRRLLDGSPIVASHRHSDHLVQDAYSLRCMPQVHGAYRDALGYIRSTLQAELDSAIDNPSVIMPPGELRSGGNFHGEALGLALDHLALCLTGFGTISERRVARLVDPELNNGLPAFLTPDPGLRSGFMLAQYTSASLVSENRTLCFPASADSIPTSAGQEDHVSMGATSARKTADILANAGHVIAIELLAAAQGLDLRHPLEPARGTGAARDVIRQVSPTLDEDRALSPDIQIVRDKIADGTMIASVGNVVGELV